MDKPLSQERLSEDEIEFVLGLVEYDLEEGHQITWGHAHTMFHEIKRLQAIELERDRYKATLEDVRTHIGFLKSVIRSGETLGKYEDIEEFKKSIKGADTNETN